MLGALVDLALPVAALLPARCRKPRVDHLLIGRVEGIERRSAVIHPHPPPIRLAEPCREPTIPQRLERRLVDGARVDGGPVRADAASLSEHLGAFKEGIAAHQPAHVRADNRGVIAPRAGAQALVHPCLERPCDPVEIAIGNHPAAGHAVHLRAQVAGGHVVEAAREILAVPVAPRRPDADDDMRLDPARLHGGEHRLVRRPDLAEVRLGDIEKIVPVMHVEHRIAPIARIIAGREPDRQALIGQACGGNALVFEQPSALLRRQRRRHQRQQRHQHSQQPHLSLSPHERRAGQELPALRHLATGQGNCAADLRGLEPEPISPQAGRA